MWVGLEFSSLKDFGLYAMAGGVSKLRQCNDGRREILFLNNMSYQELE